MDMLLLILAFAFETHGSSFYSDGVEHHVLLPSFI